MFLVIHLISNSFFTPFCLEEPLYLWGYTDPVTSRPVIIYTSAKVGDTGPWPKRKALTPFDQKWQAAIKRFSFLGVSAKDNSKHWAMRRLSQLLLLALSSSSILLYQFSNLQLGAGASPWRYLAIHGVLTKLLWKGSSEIQLQWTREGQRFPRAQGSRMVIGPRWRSKSRRLESIKNKRSQKKKSKMEFEKVMPNET
jgi:hypothetical protein